MNLRLTPALVLALLSTLVAPTLQSAELNWSRNYEEALTKARAEKRPLFLLYGPENLTKAKTFTDPLVEEGLAEFVCVQAFKDQAARLKKVTQRRGGYPNYFFVDPARETVVAAAGGFGIPARELMAAITRARAAAGLPLTPAMQKAAAAPRAPSRAEIDTLAEAGDVAGLVALLKTTEANDFRPNDYLVLQLRLPGTVAPIDAVCMVSGDDCRVASSGVVVAQLRRDSGPAKVSIIVPGCLAITDQVPLEKGAAVASREYQIEPLPAARAATLSGLVQWPDGKPAAGALVRICDWQAVVRADALGRFKIAPISPGTFLVRAEAPGGEFHETMTFTPGASVRNLKLTPVATVGIRWALQTQEGSRQLTGAGVRVGEAYFSLKNSRFLLSRGARVRESSGSDFMLMELSETSKAHPSPSAAGEIQSLPVGTPVWWLFDGNNNNGLHRETARFDTITAVNGGQPYDGRNYFEFLRGHAVRPGEVYTVRCCHRECYAKLEVIDVSPARR